MPKVGDLQVWHIPQVPGKPFTVSVSSPEEAIKILGVLAHYDIFQFENKIKPDYCNAQGLRILDKDCDGTGKPDWVDWLDDEGDDIDQWEEKRKEA